MDGWMDGWMNGWMDGWINEIKLYLVGLSLLSYGQILMYSMINPFLYLLHLFSVTT
jgi:hypothetical protein